jgi:hypothetical protein
MPSSTTTTTFPQAFDDALAQNEPTGTADGTLMNNLMRVVLLVVVTMSLGDQAKAAPPQQGGAEHSIESGMWLCLAPAPAINCWEDLILLQKTGITVTTTNIESIAKKYRCEYFASDRFKLVDVGGSSSLGVGQPPLKVTDGNSAGWVPSQEYLQYLRSHVVRKRD